jgi:hypothetical protein
VSAGEVDEQAIEPQPPPGLSRLTAAQQALAEFMGNRWGYAGCRRTLRRARFKIR